MSYIVKKRQKVKNANNYKWTYTLFFITLFISCGVTNKYETKGNYELRKYESKTGFTGVYVNTFDKDLPIHTALIVANGFAFSKECLDETSVKPNKKIEIEVVHIGYYIMKIQPFYPKKGDSIVVNAYLKEDKRPFYD